MSDPEAKRVEELHQKTISLSEERRYTEALPFAREAVELLELELPITLR